MRERGVSTDCPARALGMLSMDTDEDPCLECRRFDMPRQPSDRRYFVALGSLPAGRAVVFSAEAWCTQHNALHVHSDVVVLPADAAKEFAASAARGSAAGCMEVHPSTAVGRSVVDAADFSCCAHAEYTKEADLVCTRTGSVLRSRMTNDSPFGMPRESGAAAAAALRYKTDDVVTLPAPAQATRLLPPEDKTRRRRKRDCGPAPPPGAGDTPAPMGAGNAPPTATSSSEGERARAARTYARRTTRRLHERDVVATRVEALIKHLLWTKGSKGAPHAVRVHGERAHARLQTTMAQFDAFAVTPLMDILAAYCAETADTYADVAPHDQTYVAWVGSVVMAVGTLVAEAYRSSPEVACASCVHPEGRPTWCPTPAMLAKVTIGTLALMASTGIVRTIDPTVATESGVVLGPPDARGTRGGGAGAVHTIVPWDPTLAGLMRVNVGNTGWMQLPRGKVPTSMRFVHEVVDIVLARALSLSPNSTQAAAAVGDLCALPRWYSVSRLQRDANMQRNAFAVDRA